MKALFLSRRILAMRLEFVGEVELSDESDSTCEAGMSMVYNPPYLPTQQAINEMSTSRKVIKTYAHIRKDQEKRVKSNKSGKVHRETQSEKGGDSRLALQEGGRDAC